MSLTMPDQSEVFDLHWKWLTGGWLSLDPVDRGVFPDIIGQSEAGGAR